MKQDRIMKMLLWFGLSMVLYPFAFAPFQHLMAQSESRIERINPYSPSPVSKIRQSASKLFVPSASANAPDLVSSRIIATPQIKDSNHPEPTRSAAPSEQYTVGHGDVLYIGISGRKKYGGYYTVRMDGAVAILGLNDNISVAGSTIGELEKRLFAAMNLGSGDNIEVSVREYSSHRVFVSGLVRHSDVVILRRDAMPLFAIKAQVEVLRQAKYAIVKRAGSQRIEIHELNSTADDAILLFPGDSVHFSSTETNPFIAKESATR